MDGCEFPCLLGAKIAGEGFEVAGLGVGGF